MQLELEENRLSSTLNMPSESQQIQYQKMLDYDDFLQESKNAINDYICVICKGVYYDPVCVAKCGHVFCFSCISAYLQFNKCCPFEKEKANEDNLGVNENVDDRIQRKTQQEIYQSDLVSVDMIHSFLNKQLVFCKNRNDECNWFGKLSELKFHLENICEKQILNCSNQNCKEKFYRENLQNHLENCIWKIINCQFCLENLPLKDLESHYQKCEEYPLKCELDCECIVVRKKMKEHIDQECINEIVDCDYISFGCKDKTRRRDREDHLRSNVAEHVELLSKNTLENREKFLSEMQRLKANFSQELNSDFSKIIDLNKNIEENFKSALDENKILYHENLEKLISKIQDLEKEKNEEIEKKAKIENENSVMKEKIEELFNRISRIEEDKKASQIQKPNVNLSLLEETEIRSYEENKNSSSHSSNQNSCLPTKKDLTLSYNKDSKTPNNRLLNSSEDSDENIFLQKKRARNLNSNSKDLKTSTTSSQVLINSFDEKHTTVDLSTINKSSFKNGHDKKTPKNIKSEKAENNSEDEDNEVDVDIVSIKNREKEFGSNLTNSHSSRDLDYSKFNGSNLKNEHEMNSSPFIPFFDESQKSNKTTSIEKDQKVMVNNNYNNLKFIFGNEIKLKHLDKKGKFSFSVSILNVKTTFLMGLGIRDQISIKNSSPFCPTDPGYFIVSTDFQMFNSNNKSEDGIHSDSYKNFEKIVKQNLDNIIINFEYCYSSNSLKFSAYKKNKFLFSDNLSEVFSSTSINGSTGLCPVFIFPRGGGTISVKCM